jgi:TatD DNase family protein
VTFKNAEPLRHVVETVPLERLLVETDAPYLAPMPYRGKRNEPSFVGHTAEKLAELKGVSVSEISRVTTENFLTLFSKAKKI